MFSFEIKVRTQSDGIGSGIGSINSKSLLVMFSS